MAEDTRVIVNDKELYGKTLKTELPPERKNDIDLNNSFYTNIVNEVTASSIDITSIESLSRSAENRNEIYNLYDIMCEDGAISAIVRAYVQDATMANDSGNIVWVESSTPEIAHMVEFLLDSLNVNKNVYQWVYSLCKYGDVYLRLYRESEYEDELFISKPKKKLDENIKIKAYSKTDHYARYMEMQRNPAEMFELTKFGKTVGYIKAPTTSGVVEKQNGSIDLMTFAYKFKKQDVTLYQPTEFVHAALKDNVSRYDEEVTIFKETNDYDADSNGLSYKVNKGTSLLADKFNTWRERQLLETSILLNRLTKSSIVRVVNVELGDMDKNDVPKTMNTIKQMIEQKSAISKGQSLREYTNPGPIENNIYVPTYNGKGQITTSQIGGDVDIKSLADLEYYTDKLYGEFGVPKQYFGVTSDSTGFNGGTSLTIISSEYGRAVKRIQNTIIQMITDAINLMLIDLNLDSYVNEFTIHMVPPTTQEEIDRRESLSSKVQITSDILNMMSDIDDPLTKIKMLKALIGNIVDNTEVIELLQEQINKLESDAEEEIGSEGIDLNTTEEDFEDESSLENIEAEETAETSSEEAVLPNASDLNVDLSADIG